MVFESSLHFNRSVQWGDFACPLNTCVVNLPFRNNYAHLSHSSVCHCVSYQPSMWRAALTDGGLVFFSSFTQLPPLPECSTWICSIPTSGPVQRAIDTAWTYSRLPCLSDMQLENTVFKGVTEIICSCNIRAREPGCSVSATAAAQCIQRMCVYSMWVGVSRSAVCCHVGWGWCMGHYCCLTERHAGPSAQTPATAEP